MGPYRVILANEPRLLRGLLSRVLQKAPGVQVVGQGIDKDRLSAKVGESLADWVIVSLWQDGDLPAFLQDLVSEHPSICLLGMAADGSRARTWSLIKGERNLDGLTLDQFIAALLHPAAGREGR